MSYIFIAHKDGVYQVFDPADTVEEAVRPAAQLLSVVREEIKGLTTAPVGSLWRHPSGYDFRILEAAFTEDGALITPGIRVFNYYDHEWGTIDAGQFMHEGDLSPGGKFFDHWYDFTREGESRSFKKLNGQRLATKERP
jgi:hypothetical protein